MPKKKIEKNIKCFLTQTWGQLLGSVPPAGLAPDSTPRHMLLSPDREQMRIACSLWEQKVDK